MSAKSDEWYRRAGEAHTYEQKLELVEEVLSSDEAPEFLKNSARRCERSIKTYIQGGMSDRTDQHNADHTFASLKIAFGDVK